MPQFDIATYAPQLFWLALIFALLYLLMSRLALPRIADVLEQRQDRIASDLDKAQELKEQAESVLAEYEAALAEARAKAQARIAQSAAEMAAEAEKRNAEVTARLDREAAEATARIVDAKRQALAEVRGVAGELARAVTAKLIGVEAPQDELERAVESAMGEQA